MSRCHIISEPLCGFYSWGEIGNRAPCGRRACLVQHVFLPTKFEVGNTSEPLSNTLFLTLPFLAHFCVISAIPHKPRRLKISKRQFFSLRKLRGTIESAPHASARRTPLVPWIYACSFLIFYCHPSIRSCWGKWNYRQSLVPSSWGTTLH